MIIMKIKEFFIQAFCFKHDYSEFEVENEETGFIEFYDVCKKCGKVEKWINQK